MTQSSAITNLGNQKPESFRRQVARGIERLAANVRKLDASAHRMSADGDESTAALLGSFADEEAAKVLILIDAVRCPRSEAKARARTLKRWSKHLWKGIYVRACDWRPVDFSELESYIEEEMQPFYLDGPLGVDWIFPNEITRGRERQIYVDLVEDITESGQTTQEPYWVAPEDFSSSIGGYRTSTCVEVALSLHAQGIGTERGLKHVADIWQPIDPRSLDSSEFLTKTEETLRAVWSDAEHFTDQEEEPPSLSPLAYWPFPLWPIPEPEDVKPSEMLEALQADRDAELKRIRQLQEMKEPPPAISREKVLELDAAYARVEEARRRRVAEQPSRQGGLQIISADVDLDVSQTPAWRRLRELWWGLCEAERVSLVALAWFTRGAVANWPRALRQAQEKPDIHSARMEHYYLDLGGAWLKGLNRWETPAEQMPTGWG